MAKKHPWTTKIQVCRRGNNEEIAKTQNAMTKLKNNLLFQNRWDNIIQTWHTASLNERDSRFFFSNEESRPFPRGDDKVIAKIHWRNCNTLFQNQWTNIDQTWHTASLDEGNSGLLKWSEGSRSFPRGDNKEQSKIYWRNIKKCNNIVIWKCTHFDL